MYTASNVGFLIIEKKKDLKLNTNSQYLQVTKFSVTIATLNNIIFKRSCIITGVYMPQIVN